MTTATEYPTCEDRIDGSLEDRIKDIRQLLDLYYEGIEDDPDLGNLHDYGLSLEWSTNHEAWEQPYIRYILSTGGPHDEFQFIPSSRHRYEPASITYVFQDWFDGARREVTGINDVRTMRELYEWFIELMPEYEED